MSEPVQTLFLTSFSKLSARGHTGPGRVLCAMRYHAPYHLSNSIGRVPMAMPSAVAFSDFRHQRIDSARFRELLDERWREGLDVIAPTPRSFRGEEGLLGLSFAPWGDLPDRHMPVRGGDTLFCACAAPGSSRRTRWCHLEILAPWLVRAGWEVVLYGRRLIGRDAIDSISSGSGRQPVWEATGASWSGPEPIPVQQGLFGPGGADGP